MDPSGRDQESLSLNQTDLICFAHVAQKDFVVILEVHPLLIGFEVSLRGLDHVKNLVACNNLHQSFV